MENVLVKYLIIEVEGEAILRFPVISLPDNGRFEMMEAILASNPTCRLVDNVQIGQVWNGTEYVTTA